MATIITNRASVNYNFGTSTASAVSNTTSTTLNGALNIQKTALSDNYRIGQDITYIISIENNGTTAAEDITVTDDLGTYTLGGNEYTPLTFLGNAQLFINGVFYSVLTPDLSESNIVFDISSIPENGNAQIIYSARVNEFANGSSESVVKNTATADFVCECPCNEPVSDSNTITADAFAELRLVKSVCPNPVICGEELTYIIDVYNYGNIPATNVVLTDTFMPALADIVVTVNGAVIPESDYSYVGGILTLPNQSGETELSVPAATFSQNASTGIFEVIPGQLQITITGTI